MEPDDISSPHSQPDNASRHECLCHGSDYIAERCVRVDAARQAATDWRTPKLQHRPTVRLPDGFNLTADQQAVSYATLDNLDDPSDVFGIGPA